MKDIPLLNLTRIHESMRRELDEAIDRVLRKSSFILGEEVEAFEREFASWVGKKFAVGVGNGTDAITLSLLALGIGAGDEVATTSLSAFPTAEAILRAGARPVYVDIDPATFNIDPEKIERAITPKTKAIVPVHLYGLAADMGRITQIARSRNIPILEDCAQAHGGTFQGKKVGTFGAASAFSFFPSKNLGAMGDGGAVVTDDEAIAKRVRALRAHGEEGGRFSHKYVGANSRLDGLQAAILRVKLAHLDEHNRERRAIASFYREHLDGASVILPSPPPGYPAEHVYHLYVVRVKDASQREGFRAFLEERGVKTNVHYPIPLHKQPAYPVSASLPNVERVVGEIVSIPLFPTMEKKEMEYVRDVILSWRR
ncbi:MAG: Glutamine-scyllo-inositol transaminase [Parcubacteria group bacterium GW2011_GWB1_50_9]|uniref:Glutamine-scyllo-inositol transaminase n=1 Tax=Candidatus Kaiserbacteria bacterium GW2011_GWC2_52_8b TaxID=1618676 RepID=A0A0G1XLN4_9BACT|nr:MAG: Glutamine-scyllo-inositol transaminase [Parcubacteria group bacterium GW2011_GWB1_50_9]KKW24976.1 MAG: Glutamine-scyllo-inositol transaminase [candidate division Kazan bacterium GW2011_GWC1_52_13]KKW31780.1 MAG: Glutamine-scyllo-inositol transaminase [Candidatus Kaiserbacteria bacterium GW2011_GWC2_52_8b]